MVAVRALADEDTARLAAPFVAVAPTAIWVAVSADGYFAGVAAWGIALLALAVRHDGAVAGPGRPRVPGSCSAGAIFLNYGLALMALPAVGGAALRDGPGGPPLRALVPAVLAALAVVGVFALAGFWWFDGYTLVQQRYWQGIANDRPFQYWAGPTSRRWCARSGWAAWPVSAAHSTSRRSGGAPGLHLVVLGALLAILCADLSHAEQGRDRTHLAAVHGLAHRRRPRCCRRGHTAGGWRSTSSVRCCSTTSS